MRQPLLAIILLFFLFVPGAGAEEKPLHQLAKDNQPIDIAADRLEADDLAHQVKFLGHVVVRRGDVTLYAKEVTVYYLENRGNIDRIAAVGEVRIVQGERIATADRALLIQKEGKIILSGTARLRQGQDLVQGEEVTVFINEERSVIKGAEGGRVKAVFHPKLKEETP